MTTEVWIAVAIGVAVPVVLLLGPYVPYLLPRLSLRLFTARDHKPSRCFQSFGEHLSEWLQYDIARTDGGNPGPEPVFRCPCSCRMCSRGGCAWEYSMYPILREQREGFAARHSNA